MRARTPRPNWTFDWPAAGITGSRSPDRGRIIRFERINHEMGRIEGCRFIEGGKVAQKKARKLSVAERVARLEEQLTPRKDGHFFSLFDRPCWADEVRYLRSEVNDLTARLGTPGVPLFIYTARLSCSTVVRIVARTIDEATAKAHAFVRYQDHDASVLSVTQEGDQVDVC